MASEACPKCGRIHEVGPYMKQEKTEKGQVVAPNDIDCPCGLTLRWVVPIIRVTNSGYLLRPKPDSEPKRASTEAC